MATVEGSLRWGYTEPQKTQTKERDTEAKNGSIHTYLQNISAYHVTDNSLRKATRKIKQLIISVLPMRKNCGKWAKNKKQSVDLFADTFLPT